MIQPLQVLLGLPRECRDHFEAFVVSFEEHAPVQRNVVQEEVTAERRHYSIVARRDRPHGPRYSRRCCRRSCSCSTRPHHREATRRHGLHPSEKRPDLALSVEETQPEATPESISTNATVVPSGETRGPESSTDPLWRTLPIGNSSCGLPNLTRHGEFLTVWRPVCATDVLQELPGCSAGERDLGQRAHSEGSGIVERRQTDGQLTGARNGQDVGWQTAPETGHRGFRHGSHRVREIFRSSPTPIIAYTTV